MTYPTQSEGNQSSVKSRVSICVHERPDERERQETHRSTCKADGAREIKTEPAGTHAPRCTGAAPQEFYNAACDAWGPPMHVGFDTQRKYHFHVYCQY
jgi:hypothetical protein